MAPTGERHKSNKFSRQKAPQQTRLIPAVLRCIASRHLRRCRRQQDDKLYRHIPCACSLRHVLYLFRWSLLDSLKSASQEQLQHSSRRLHRNRLQIRHSRYIPVRSCKPINHYEHTRHMRELVRPTGLKPRGRVKRNARPCLLSLQLDQLRHPLTYRPKSQLADQSQSIHLYLRGESPFTP